MSICFAVVLPRTSAGLGGASMAASPAARGQLCASVVAAGRSPGHFFPDATGRSAAQTSWRRGYLGLEGLLAKSSSAIFHHMCARI